MMHPSLGAFAAQPEVTDMQQRLRVAADTLSRDLIMAGAGAYRGPHAGPLVYSFPPVLPYRRGVTKNDPPGTFAADRVTIISVPSTSAQTTLGASLSGAAASFAPAVDGLPSDPGTWQGGALCGFAGKQTALVYDGSGSYNLCTIASAADGTRRSPETTRRRRRPDLCRARSSRRPTARSFSKPIRFN
jgi:hypothetical protein